MITPIFLLIALIATSDATDVCSATRQIYLDNVCCGEGQQTVCVSPTFTPPPAAPPSLVCTKYTPVTRNGNFGSTFCTAEIETNILHKFPPEDSGLTYLSSNDTLRLPNEIESSVYATNAMIMSGAEYCATPAAMERSFAQTNVTGWPNPDDYTTRSAYSSAAFALVKTVDETVDPVLFHTVRVLAILNTLLVLEGIASAYADSAITTHWLSTVFEHADSQLYPELRPNTISPIDAAKESWVILRNISAAFEAYASGYDSAGYGFGSTNMNDKGMFFGAVIDEHYIIAKAAAVPTQIDIPLELGPRGYIDTFDLCLTSKKLQHYMLTQETSAYEKIACTEYGKTILKSIKDILIHKKDNTCPTWDEVNTINGVLSVMTVYASPSGAQRLNVDGDGSGFRGSSYLLTVDQYTTIWRLVIKILRNHLPTVYASCDADKKPTEMYPVPILFTWNAVTITADTDSVAGLTFPSNSSANADMIPYHTRDPAWDENGQIIEPETCNAPATMTTSTS